MQDSQPETSVERMDLDMSESEYLTNIQQQICTVESTQQPKPEREKSPIQKRTQRKFILKHPNSVQTEVVVERKKSWGKLIKSLSDKQLPSINLKDIQNMCSDIVFPSENEVKFLTSLTEKKRRLLSESRKVSTEEPEKSTDYTTQTSVNSTSSTDGLKLEEEANIIAMNRKISIVDDSVSKLKPPPSPAKNPVSAVLFITNLVRPFTLKQLKELLERTGKIKEDGFWTDRIKSKCYVHYETTEYVIV